MGIQEKSPSERGNREHTQGLWIASVAGLCQVEWVPPPTQQSSLGILSKGIFEKGADYLLTANYISCILLY